MNTLAPTWADRAVQRRNLERQQTRRRHLSWVAGALAVGLSALIVASVFARPAATLTPPDGHGALRVWVTVVTTCAPIHTMYVDEAAGECKP